MPVRAALEAVVELAEALGHAHTRTDDDGKLLGIVHRDLKPSNVLVTRDGMLKISDWGLVKSSLNIDSTSRGIVKGTPGYIAPEVWGGTRDFKPTADLFALGAMLYEMVVGERLFRGKNLARIAEQVARRKPEEEAARVRARCPELEVVLARMLQRAPQKRYATAEEFAEVLRPIRDRYPTTEGLKPFIHSIQAIVDELGPQASRPVAGGNTVTEEKAPSMPNLADSEGTPPPELDRKEPGFTVHSPTAKHIEVPAASKDLAGGAASFDEDEGTVPAVRRRPGRVVDPRPPHDPSGASIPGPPPATGSVEPPGPRFDAKQSPAPAGGGRRRAVGPVRRSGPSTVLGVCVALVGVLLLGIGVYAFTQFGL
jgi:serine/threonine protein kinase